MSEIETTFETTAGQFCDGLSPRYYPARLRLRGHELDVLPKNQSPLTYSMNSLVVAAPYRTGKPLALSPIGSGKVRILIEDAGLVEAIIARRPDLKLSSARAEQISNKWPKLKIALAVIGAFAGLAWLFDAVLPQRLAYILPLSWRVAAGEAQEQSFADLGSRCNSADAENAMTTLLTVLARGDADMPNVSVHIYDFPFVNAFALPGGRVIFSKKLIDEAERPEEVAGVLAHEIGHVTHADPEAHLIRNFAFQVFYDALGSSKSGGTTSMLEQLRQSRASEEAADAYARKTMLGAQVDPLGLKSMFSRLLKREQASKSNILALGTLDSMFSTHPGTETRIAKIEPLPDTVKAVAVLSDAQWQAMRKPCN